MASSENYLNYVLDLLSDVDDVSFRKMMGEYVLYCRGIVFGGIYDDQFLIKATNSTHAALPKAELISPYPRAKEMIVVDNENPELLASIVHAMLPELPAPKKKK